ncbi:MAG: DUF1761 domain-containing protein [Candidatus Vogelbacteria bacterium]|nr:DUF1761 domain-containing protein [Candidatus Vogelbacteria bacterium]
MILFSDINFWAVLGTAIVMMVVGMVWYSPKVFGIAWMRLAGLTEERTEQTKQGMWKMYVSGLVGAIATSFVMAYFVIVSDALMFASGAWVGFLVWLGFNAPVLMGMVTWEGRPIKLYAINTSYYLVTFPLIGGLLALWL